VWPPSASPPPSHPPPATSEPCDVHAPFHHPFVLQAPEATTPCVIHRVDLLFSTPCCSGSGLAVCAPLRLVAVGDCHAGTLHLFNIRPDGSALQPAGILGNKPGSPLQVFREPCRCHVCVRMTELGCCPPPPIPPPADTAPPVDPVFQFNFKREHINGAIGLCFSPSPPYTLWVPSAGLDRVQGVREQCGVC
jgi:hypothetical protein